MALDILTAEPVVFKAVAEVRNMAISFSGKLKSGKLLASITTVAVTPAGPTTSNVPAVSTAALTIQGKNVPIGEACQFAVTGGTADTTYTWTITAVDDSSPAETLVGKVVMRVL